MVTDKIKELNAARVKLASLEQSIAEDLNKELASLPGKYGYGSVEELVAALQTAAGSGGSAGGSGGKGRRRGRPPGKANKPAAAAAAPAKGRGRRRRTRAVITDETRAQVKKMVDAGKTGANIAEALKISLPSVQNIKKALGLVRER